jgi:hypothetical protein
MNKKKSRNPTEVNSGFLIAKGKTERTPECFISIHIRLANMPPWGCIGPGAKKDLVLA